MVLSGPLAPIGGSQNILPSPLRSNFGVLEVRRVPFEATFPSPVDHLQMNNMLGNMPNMSSLRSQSFGNNSPNPAFSSSLSGQSRDELEPLANIGNGMGYGTPSSLSWFPPVNPGTSGQFQGQQFLNPSNQMIPDQSSSQPLETQNFSSQQIAQQFSGLARAPREGLEGPWPVKLKPQMMNKQLRSMNNLNALKLDSQQLPSPSMRNLPPVKMDPQQSSDSQIFPEQHRQLIQLPSQPSSLSQGSPLQKQRPLQFQPRQQQKQQLVKALPQQGVQIPNHFQQQSTALKPSSAKSGYEAGMCARRLTHYIYQQRNRPKDNNIEFWRKFVDKYYLCNVEKKWCLSIYGSGRQTNGFLRRGARQCNLCNRKPGCGFVATFEALPMLFKTKYESGTLEELLHIDMPREYQNPSGQIVLEYAKATQESIFDQLRVVREGQLRIVFSPDLKICSWEFCARSHKLIPQRPLLPQTNQLDAAVAQKYQGDAQNASQEVEESQKIRNSIISPVRQPTQAVGWSFINGFGFPKRFMRCLQTIEVVNSMKDLIDHSLQTGTGPIESLRKIPWQEGATTHVSSLQAEIPDEQLQQQQNRQSSGSIGLTHSGNNNNYNSKTLQASPAVLSENSLLNITVQQPEPEPNSTEQSTMQKILQSMMSNDATRGSGAPSGLLGNGRYGSMGSSRGGLGQSAMMVNGLRAAMENNNKNNSGSLMNGQVGIMSSMVKDGSTNRLQQQQDLGNGRKRAREPNNEWAWAQE